MKLGLGTVQWGSRYGISNQKGQTSAQEAAAILKLAAAQGIDVLDTAPAYGESESCLGQALTTRHGFQVVTKSPHYNAAELRLVDAHLLTSTLHQSLDRLRQTGVHALLIHRGVDLLKPGGELVIEELETLRSAGLVRRTGVSVYTGEEIDNVLKLFKPDIIQLPMNVLDQRLIQSDWLPRLKKAGIEIHVRSIFLQGLLLMPTATLDGYFDQVKGQLEAYHSYIKTLGLSVQQGPLAFIRSLGDLVDVALIGVCSVSELEENLAAFKVPLPQKIDFSPFACSDEEIINPVLWKIAAH